MGAMAHISKPYKRSTWLLPSTHPTSGGEMSGKKRKLSAASWAKAMPVAPSIRKYVSKRLSRLGEHKSVAFNAVVSVGTQAVAPYDSSICLIQQGTGDGQRVADKIQLKSLKVRLAWFGSDTFQVVRFILYRKTNYASTMTTTFNECPDPQNYQIIADWYDCCSGSVAPLCKSRSLDIPLKGTVSYVGQNTTDDSHGAIWLHAVSDSSAVSHPSLYVSTLVRYTDL